MREIVSGLWWLDELGSTVNVYLWRRDDGRATLIDAGMPWQGYAILKAIGDAGYAFSDVDRIIVTHADFDHVGALAQVRVATGAQVIAHAAETPAIMGQSHRRLSKSPVGYLMAPLFRLMNGVIFKYRPSRVDEMALEKQVLAEGFVVYHVPGHASGQIALYHPARKILIAADALANRGGKLGLFPEFLTQNKMQVVESIRKLAKLDVDVLCVGHGRPIVGNAGEQLRAFAATL